MTYAEREKERLRRRNEARRGKPQPMTAEQRERRRQYDKSRLAARRLRREEQKPKAPTGQTVEQFLANGGRIERLPGIQQSTTYQPRRPVTQFRGAQAL